MYARQRAERTGTNRPIGLTTFSLRRRGLAPRLPERNRERPWSERELPPGRAPAAFGWRVRRGQDSFITRATAHVRRAHETSVLCSAPAEPCSSSFARCPYPEGNTRSHSELGRKVSGANDTDLRRESRSMPGIFSEAAAPFARSGGLFSFPRPGSSRVGRRSPRRSAGVFRSFRLPDGRSFGAGPRTPRGA